MTQRSSKSACTAQKSQRDCNDQIDVSGFVRRALARLPFVPERRRHSSDVSDYPDVYGEYADENDEVERVRSFESFTPAPLPDGLQRDDPHRCSVTALKIAVRFNLTPVRGYALFRTPERNLAWLGHWWAVTEDGRVVDASWSETGVAYLGERIAVKREPSPEGGSVLSACARHGQHQRYRQRTKSGQAAKSFAMFATMKHGFPPGPLPSRANSGGAPARGRGTLIHGDLAIDQDRVEVRRDGHPLLLTPAEFRLLAALVQAAGRVLSRQALLDALYGPAQGDALERTIDVHVGRLRDKLGEDVDRPRYIATVRGAGYRAVDE